jgi:putative intracellular protease/amidase
LGTICVLIEAHFDETEYLRFNELFPALGYGVEYVSHLWGNDELVFTGNDGVNQVTVSKEVTDTDPEDYAGIILIGGYAMDRLRYQEHPGEGEPNRAPAVEFLRKAVKAMDAGRLKIGTICHSMWLFCAAGGLLEGRSVTCAHNITCDVENAGGTVVYDGNQTVDTHVEGGLISARHPGVVDEFLDVFIGELQKHKQAGQLQRSQYGPLFQPGNKTKEGRSA